MGLQALNDCCCTYLERLQQLRGYYESGHTANIFCTKFMPGTNSEVIISCAGDYEVEENVTLNNTQGIQVKAFNVNYAAGGNDSNNFAKMVASFSCHEGRVKKLATGKQST